MTGLVRKALTAAAGLALVASVASAGVPDPRNSTVESVIVGSHSGAALPPASPGFDVTVRDVNNAPLANRTVVLDFSATSIRIQSTGAAGTTINCGAGTISRLTNGAGLASFAPRFGGFVNSNSVEVAADGVVLANVPARSTDIVIGASGDTGLPDFGAFSTGFLGIGGPAGPELNFDLDGTNAGLGDFGIFAGQFLAGGSGAYCP